MPAPKAALLTACVALCRLFPYKCTELGGWHGVCPERELAAPLVAGSTLSSTAVIPADFDAAKRQPALPTSNTRLCCSPSCHAADFFDSDPVFAEWTPKAEAAAPDAPCRRVDKVEIAEIADRVRIPWTDYETMAISKVLRRQPAAAFAARMLLAAACV